MFSFFIWDSESNLPWFPLEFFHNSNHSICIFKFVFLLLLTEYWVIFLKLLTVVLSSVNTMVLWLFYWIFNYVNFLILGIFQC